MDSSEWNSSPKVLAREGRTRRSDEELTVAVFMDGYNTGLTWPDKWESHGRPGGPWVCGPTRPDPTPEQLERYRFSRLMNETWRRGWRWGHAAKHGRIAPPKEDW